MRITWLLFIVLILGLACRREPEVVTHPELEELFRSYSVEGAFAMYDERRRTFHLYDSARCDRGFLPASTFKIPHSLIILETGALPDTGTVIPWDGQESWNADWNRNHTLRTAFRTSCVPCYQQLAHRVGVQRMRRFTEAFDYGQMRIDTNNLSYFWLRGESAISPFGQIDFLRRLSHEQLPVRVEHQRFVKDIMRQDSTDAYTLRAKTGWAVTGRTNIGWWVGWVERGNDVYYFATNISAPDDTPDFGNIRTALTRDILRELRVIPVDR